jgi:predicted cupin superfamily sugar epimerase
MSRSPFSIKRNFERCLVGHCEGVFYTDTIRPSTAKVKGQWTVCDVV